MTSSGYRLGVLLTSCQSPTTKNYPNKNLNIVTVKKPCFINYKIKASPIILQTLPVDLKQVALTLTAIFLICKYEGNNSTYLTK